MLGPCSLFDTTQTSPPIFPEADALFVAAGMDVDKARSVSDALVTGAIWLGNARMARQKSAANTL